jgi:hypothetical protein
MESPHVFTAKTVTWMHSGLPASSIRGRIPQDACSEAPRIDDPRKWPLALLLLAAVCYRAYDLLPASSAAKKNLEPRWDEDPQGEDSRSRDLDHDLEAMWRTVPIAGETWEVSPVSAVNAGWVFTTVELKGKTRAEAELAIRYDPRLPPPVLASHEGDVGPEVRLRQLRLAVRRHA